MPSPSQISDKLANDLVEVGELFGFESIKETPKQTDLLQLSVYWNLLLPIVSPFPPTNILSIEIHPNSPSSTSNNKPKAESRLHASFHIIISYSKLADRIKESSKLDCPFGLAIIEGQDQIDSLNRCIQSIISNANDEFAGNKARIGFLDFVKEKKVKKELAELIEPVFKPVVYYIAAEFQSPMGTFIHSYFSTDEIEEAKEEVIRQFKEDMDHAPLEWAGQPVSLNDLEITSYQFYGKVTPEKTIEKEDIFSVIIRTKLGSEDNYFEITRQGFGENPKETENYVATEVKEGIAQMKTISHNSFGQQTQFGHYKKIRTWRETQNLKVTMKSSANFPHGK